MNERMSAFTIAELLVAMIISSIVISMVSAVVFYQATYTEMIQRKGDQLTSIAQMKFVLENDLMTSLDFKWNHENSWEIIKPNTVVSYDVYADTLVRRDQVRQVVDTFLIVLGCYQVKEDTYHFLISTHGHGQTDVFWKPNWSSQDLVEKAYANSSK